MELARILRVNPFKNMGRLRYKVEILLETPFSDLILNFQLGEIYTNLDIGAIGLDDAGIFLSDLDRINRMVKNNQIFEIFRWLVENQHRKSITIKNQLQFKAFFPVIEEPFDLSRHYQTTPSGGFVINIPQEFLGKTLTVLTRNTQTSILEPSPLKMDMNRSEWAAIVGGILDLNKWQDVMPTVKPLSLQPLWN